MKTMAAILAVLVALVGHLDYQAAEADAAHRADMEALWHRSGGKSGWAPR